MKKYLDLIRVKHYVKNVLVFLPLVFVKRLFTMDFLVVFYGFLAFCFMASIVYIINDFQDLKADRAHEIKKHRPLAKGIISKTKAILIILLLSLLVIIFGYLAVGFNLWSFSLLFIYLIINIIYSYGAKNIALLDILLLVIGFVLRVYYGAAIIGAPVSNWMYLTIMSASFFLALGKRRNEMKKAKTFFRNSLKVYTVDFLDRYMSITTGLAITFYSLWAIEVHKQYFVVTIPLVIMIFMRYTLIIEKNSHGDPTDVLFSDRFLQILIVIFGLAMIYFML